MAECKDIDKALANLSKKIDDQNRCCNDVKRQLTDLNNRIRQLEQGQGKQGNDKNQDLTAIRRRLAALENYISLLDTDIKTISKFIDEIQENLEPVFKFIEDLGNAIIKGFNKLFNILP